MRKTYIFFIGILLLAVLPITAKSQSLIENIQWVSHTFVDNASQEQGTGTFTFTTSTSQFSMSNGQRTITFSVNDIAGTWTDLELNGELTCQIRSGERTGTAIVGRRQGNLIIIINFSSYKDGMFRTFSIDRFNRL